MAIKGHKVDGGNITRHTVRKLILDVPKSSRLKTRKGVSKKIWSLFTTTMSRQTKKKNSEGNSCLRLSPKLSHSFSEENNNKNLTAKNSNTRDVMAVPRERGTPGPDRDLNRGQQQDRSAQIWSDKG